MSDVRLNFINVGKIDCRDGRNAVKITFRNRTTWDVHRAEIYADDKIVGICMLVNANEEDTVMCEIDKLTGIHNIKIRVDEGAFIKTAEFIYVEDFSKCDYVPTPDDVVRDLHTEQWEATDMLGRHIASVEDTRGAKKDKLVGMFYWSWREAHKNRRPVNVTEILSKYPAAEYLQMRVLTLLCLTAQTATFFGRMRMSLYLRASTRQEKKVSTFLNLRLCSTSVLWALLTICFAFCIKTFTVRASIVTFGLCSTASQ